MGFFNVKKLACCMGYRPRFARLAASPLARACALPLLNRKKKRDCSQSTRTRAFNAISKD